MILRAYTVYTGMVCRAYIEQLRGVWDVCRHSIECIGFVGFRVLGLGIRITQGLGWAPSNSRQLTGV